MTNKILGKNITNEELCLAILLLEGVPKCRTITSVLKELQTNSDKGFDLINRPEYVETILWSREDIEKALVDEHLATSDENIDVVIKHIGKRLEDRSIETGWDAIYTAIAHAKRINALEAE